MNKRLEDFSVRELLQRQAIQQALHTVLGALKQALDKQHYNDALYLNVQGAKVLRMLVERDLALPDEQEMLGTLRDNINGILKLQYRLQ